VPTTNSLAAVVTAAGAVLVLLVVLSAPGQAGTVTTSTTVPSTEPGVEVHIILSGDCAPENGAEVTVANHLDESVEVHVDGILVGSVVGGSSQLFVVDLFGVVEIIVGGAPIAFTEGAVCSSEDASPAGANSAPVAASAATSPPTPVTAAPSFAG
jgi:hypothetical protein